jgi:hypothetical protein
MFETDRDVASSDVLLADDARMFIDRFEFNRIQSRQRTLFQAGKRQRPRDVQRGSDCPPMTSRSDWLSRTMKEGVTNDTLSCLSS